MSKKEKSDVKFSEKFSLKVRKTIIASKIFTILVVIALISAFVGLNVWVQSLDLPEIDVTANKLYTLSDSSKNALADVDQDIKIYVFGIDESDSVVGLIKQYCAVNDKISYEMLSKESNLEKVQKFDLEDGYSIVVIESGDSYKIIDASSEFHSYDYSTYSEIDTTEQTLTNSILGLITKNKPKVYFLTGHSEFSTSAEESKSSELGVLTTYLTNEAIEYDTLNLLTTGKVPDDCNVLAIMSPASDFLENEVQYVLDYINKGGNIFFTKDILSTDVQLPNIQKILDVYGVTVDNGYILETDSNKATSKYPYVFQPQVSSTNEITSDISSDSYMLLAYAERVTTKSEDELAKLNVSYEELLGTSDSALYVTDFTSDATAAASSAQTGHWTVAGMATKTISEGTTNEKTGETEGAVESKLVVSGCGRFMTDYVVTEVSNQYPLSYIGSNKDFAINTIAKLSNKEGGLTLRKDMAGTSYRFTASAKQNAIVLGIIFAVPVVVIIIGIIVGKHRKKRK